MYRSKQQNYENLKIIKSSDIRKNDIASQEKQCGICKVWGVMKESDIKFEQGDFWVAKHLRAYGVFKNVGTYAVCDSYYPLTDDGLSIAMARCKYLAGLKPKES